MKISKIKWLDLSTPGMSLIEVTPPSGEPALRDYAASLASSLVGLTLEQVENKLGELDGGYHAWDFTMSGKVHSFRISPTDERGRRDISLYLGEDGVVLRAQG